MSENRKQLTNSAYRLPVNDTEFLLSDSMRGVRFLLEYAKAEEILREWGVRSTVVVFGSARVLPAADDSASLDTPSHPSPRSAFWYEEARRFGRLVSERGGARSPIGGVRDNVIATGGGPGIMEAANRGAREAGAPSIGFNIRLRREEEPNPYSSPDLTFQFHYFAMRKMHLVMRAAALVVFPGGFGTLDELFEVLNLIQTLKMQPVPIICIDEIYWRRIVNFSALADEGMIDRESPNLISFAENAEGAWASLVAGGLRLPPVDAQTPS